MKRISSGHTHFFLCQQIQPTENCTRPLEKHTGQFLKSVRSTNSSKELQKPTFLLTSITFQNSEARIRKQAGSEAFIVPCRKPHLATRIVSTAPATGWFFLAAKSVCCPKHGTTHKKSHCETMCWRKQEEKGKLLGSFSLLPWPNPSLQQST